jgi:plastocyanin
VSGEKRNLKPARWFILLVVAGMIALTAWGSYKTVCIPDIRPAEPQGGNVQIWIQDNNFSPASINIPAGTTIHWTNMDAMTHTVTSDTGLFDSKNMSKGSNFSHTFSEKGTFTYHCAIHSFMKGTIIVE